MSTTIPFGPQHPVLPEPIHVRLDVEDEIVRSAVPAIGYVHRGLETLATLRDFQQMLYVVERVCGICSAMHGLCYCLAIEDVMKIEVPARANFLRTIWTEIHRIHSHLLWFGLYADAFGFESVFMECWKIREMVMDINEATAGSRVIISVNVIGGVRRNLSSDQLKWILQTLEEVERRIRGLEKTLLNDYTVKKRTVGIAVLTKEKAYELGAAGPMIRGSGIAQDIRMNKYAAFTDLDFEPVVETAGDCYARAKVRYREMLQSIDLVRQAISRLPEGEIAAKFKGFPNGEATSRVEQPRGECLYYVKANGSKNLDRCRIRTPTFANVAPLVHLLQGLELADVPVTILTIDPCISCTER